MSILAVAGVCLGEIAVLLDLGNRLFGSYARTPAGMIVRIAALVAACLTLAAPMAWNWIDPASAPAKMLLHASAACGLLLFVHFLRPYQFGIRRVLPAPEATNYPLAAGVVLRKATIELGDLPSVMDGCTLLVISDLHCNSASHLGLLRDVADRLSDSSADLVFVLGDFGETKSLLPETVEAVARLSGRCGTYCVLGNHDYEGGREHTLQELLRQHGIRLLTDEVQRIPEIDLWLLGLAHPWNRSPAPSEAAGGFCLCLTHSPDNVVYFERLQVKLGVAGHTHGGKLRLPWAGAILVPSRLGRFLDRGWFRLRDSLLYVTPGIGYFPGRFGNVGEVLQLTLRRRLPDAGA